MPTDFCKGIKITHGTAVRREYPNNLPRHQFAQSLFSFEQWQRAAKAPGINDCRYLIGHYLLIRHTRQIIYISFQKVITRSVVSINYTLPLFYQGAWLNKLVRRQSKWWSAFYSGWLP